MGKQRSTDEFVIIESDASNQLFDLKELLKYKDLLRFLIQREIRTDYAQTILGVGWAVLKPIITMVVFTVIFGNLAKIKSDGIPYSIFSFSGLVSWTYFSSALQAASTTLVVNANMISKIYFPRILLPLVEVIAKLLDFSLAFLVLILMMVWFQVAPNVTILTLPIFIILMIMTTLGLGVWMTALSIQYRDVKYAVSFGVQLLMYASPLVYPSSIIPDRYRLIFGLNPMAGVIEGFRSALLGKTPMPWDMILIGSLSALVILVSGLIYFQRKERFFADVA
jgi:lipopolysaccharide transport system permease protein